MNPGKKYLAVVNAAGGLELPAELRASLGLEAGATVLIRQDDDELWLERPVSSLAKVYVEPTNQCNLDCRTCMRNVWDEPLGFLSQAVFERILDGLAQFTPRPTVFFGGFGEPLLHPEILPMVKEARQAGAQVELISNGILLSEDCSRGLIDAGLDVLWVSLDGASPESFADVRLGAALPQVIQNLERLAQLRRATPYLRPELGIAFVAMKRNIADLPEILKLGGRLGASRYLVTNVLAHTPELRHEILYKRVMDQAVYSPSVCHPSVSLPRLDFDSITQEPMAKVFNSGGLFSLGSHEIERSSHRCPFIFKGSTSIRWDGALSPCLSLLHTHASYLGERQRFVKAFSVGNILQRNLEDLWKDPNYLSLRQKIQDFDFSPCVLCNSCEMADENMEDCFGNAAPTCGGCLWAQGLIQCP